ncbi:hypothetical protein MRX96_050820 [Rhipicephalus microplus]
MDGAFIDNEVLIAAVQHRLPLWMASHRQHKDKIVKAAMWREVAAAVLPNVNIDDAAELVQKRWKSLRDKFRRLFVANKKAKSGAGLDDGECITITWPYFQLLCFLKDTMQTRATSGNYVSPASLQSTSSFCCSPGEPVRPASQLQAGRQPPRPDSPTTRIGMNVQELLQDMVQFEDQCLELSEASAHSDDDAFRPPGVVCPNTQERTAPEPAVTDGSAGSTPTQRRSRKRKNEEELDRITQNVQDLCETLKKTESRNEHEYFGLCLAKYFEKMPEKRQLELKVKIMQLVMEYVD